MKIYETAPNPAFAQTIAFDIPVGVGHGPFIFTSKDLGVIDKQACEGSESSMHAKCQTATSTKYYQGGWQSTRPRSVRAAASMIQPLFPAASAKFAILSTTTLASSPDGVVMENRKTIASYPYNTVTNSYT